MQAEKLRKPISSHLIIITHCMHRTSVQLDMCAKLSVLYTFYIVSSSHLLQPFTLCVVFVIFNHMKQWKFLSSSSFRFLSVSPSQKFQSLPLNVPYNWLNLKHVSMLFRSSDDVESCWRLNDSWKHQFSRSRHLDSAICEGSMFNVHCACNFMWFLCVRMQTLASLRHSWIIKIINFPSVSLNRWLIRRVGVLVVDMRRL